MDQAHDLIRLTGDRRHLPYGVCMFINPPFTQGGKRSKQKIILMNDFLMSVNGQTHDFHIQCTANSISTSYSNTTLLAYFLKQIIYSVQMQIL